MSPKGKEVVVESESESEATLEVKSSKGKEVVVESESEADVEVRSSKGKEVVVESEVEVGLEDRSSKGKEVVVESEAELEVMLSKGEEVVVESEAEVEVKPLEGKEVVVESENKSEAKSSKSKRKNKGKGKGKGKGKVVDCRAPVDSPPKKFVVLRSSDKVEFEVEESLAQRSDMLKHMIEDVAVDDGIPLPNITGSVLAMVIEYWKHHAEGVEGSEEMKKWDADFAHCDGNYDKRYDLLLAANYLAAKPLFELLIQAVADAVKDMKVEEVREYLSIENDITEEEEKVYKQEYAWAFEI